MSSRFLKQKLFGRTRDQHQKHTHEYHSLLEQSDGSEDDSPSKGVKLPLRSKTPSPHFMEYAVEPGQTLQSIALRFNCSVAQIKQANNILRENEIYALRTLRIPISPFSLVRETLAPVHSSHGSLKTINAQENKSMGNISTAILLPIGDSIASSSLKTANDCYRSDESLHDPLCTPIPLPYQPCLDLDAGAHDVDIPELQRDQFRSAFHCSGVDGGLSWLALVLCSLILGFAGPLIYIFFVYERQQEKVNGQG